MVAGTSTFNSSSIQTSLDFGLAHCPLPHAFFSCIEVTKSLIFNNDSEKLENRWLKGVVDGDVKGRRFLWVAMNVPCAPFHVQSILGIKDSLHVHTLLALRDQVVGKNDKSFGNGFVGQQNVFEVQIEDAPQYWMEVE